MPEKVSRLRNDQIVGRVHHGSAFLSDRKVVSIINHGLKALGFKIQLRASTERISLGFNGIG
jgi:hypothetical protein